MTQTTRSNPGGARLRRIRMALSVLPISALLAVGNLSTAAAHPHDLLAQCQLPNGKWVMCDETVHGGNGGHVPANAPLPRSKPKSLTIEPADPDTPKLRMMWPGHAGGRG